MTAIIRQEGEGEQFWFAGGGIFTMKATTAETGGAFCLFDDRMQRGKTTPLHLHPDFDEALYRSASEPITSPADYDRPADFGRLRAAAEASPSIEILGPPPFKLEPA